MNEFINLEGFNKYLAQMPPGGETDRIAEIPVVPRIEEPVPVPVTQTPSADAIASYGIQGLVITFMVYVGKPVLEKLYLFFSEGARAKRERQLKAEEAQIKQVEQLEITRRDQRDFLEQFVQQQQQQLFSELQVVMKSQREQLGVIERSIAAQTETLKQLLKSPLTVRVEPKNNNPQSSHPLEQVRFYPSSPISAKPKKPSQQPIQEPDDEEF